MKYLYDKHNRPWLVLKEYYYDLDMGYYEVILKDAEFANDIIKVDVKTLMNRTIQFRKPNVMEKLLYE